MNFADYTSLLNEGITSSPQMTFLSWPLSSGLVATYPLQWTRRYANLGRAKEISPTLRCVSRLVA